MCTKIANFFARYSVAEYNKCRPLRVVCRVIYRSLAAIYCLLVPAGRRRDWRLAEGSLRPQSRRIIWAGNLYPWPYRDPNFAPWAETDDNLITDHTRSVIRYSTSCMAHFVRWATGRWLKKPTGRYDAKRWHELLEYNGFEQVSGPYTPGYYIGILPDVGEWGELIWHDTAGYGRDHTGEKIYFSTYRDHKPYYGLISLTDPRVKYWYKIS